MKRLCHFIILLFISPITAYAVDDRFTTSIELASATTALNTSNVINKYAQLSSSSNIDDSTSALLFSFGYILDDYLSIGADLITAGSLTANDTGTSYKLFSTDTISVYARISKAITSSVSVYGKLGAHLWSLSENLTAPGGLDDGVDLTYGVGTHIDVYGGSNRQLQLQWNHYEYNGVYVESQDVVSLGILFLF